MSTAPNDFPPIAYGPEDYDRREGFLVLIVNWSNGTFRPHSSHESSEAAESAAAEYLTAFRAAKPGESDAAIVVPATFLG